jgi:hypothetical protein
MAMKPRLAARPPASRYPWDPVELEPREISGIKAMAAQHPVAFAAVLKIARTDEMSFSAGGEDGRRATDYAEGKRAVGVTLRGILAMKLQPEGRGAPPDDLPNSPTPSAEPKT